MKQSTSFGTAYAEGMVQQDVLLAQDGINYTLKKGEKLNVDFASDSKTAVTSTYRKGDYTEDDDDVYSPNESDAYDNDSIEEEIDSWLNYIRTDIKSLAKTIRSTAGGVAHFVHRSAVTVVNEIKSLDTMDYDDDDDVVVHNGDDAVEIDERNVGDVTTDDVVDEKQVNDDDVDAGMNSEVKNNTNTNIKIDMYPFCGSMKSSTKLLLPWELEITDQDKRTTPSSPYFNDLTLKQRILQISQAQENFVLQNHSHNDANASFNDFSSTFDSDISPVYNLIKELLKHDTQLFRVHTKHKFNANAAAKTMMSDDEKSFWYNYFYACTMVRNQYIFETESALTSKVIDMDIPNKTNISREDVEPMIGNITGTMMSPRIMNDDSDAAIPITTELDDTRSKNDDDDDDDNSYICLSETDERNSTTNIPKAPYSSGMKSIDSMVFVEDVVSPSSDSSTIAVATTTTTTNTKNISNNFFRFFA